MSDREAMKLALEALEFNQARWQGKDEAITALRTALAAPRPEPEPWWCVCKEADAALKEDKT